MRLAAIVVTAFAGGLTPAWAQTVTTPAENDGASRPALVRVSAERFSEQTAFETLYTSFGILQMLDAHSTTRAVAAGAYEANAAFAGIAHRPLLLMGAKLAVTAGTLTVMERVRKKHPRLAMVTMMAVNSAYAGIVVRNSRITQQLNTRSAR